MTMRMTARVAGLFYLLTTAAGLFYVFTGPSTASAIAANEPFYRINITANLIAAGAYVVVTCLLYQLFKPVDKGLAMLGAFFSFIGIASSIVSFACDTAPLYLLNDPNAVSMWMHLSGAVQNAGLIFFGVYCLTIGYLAYKSGYLPKTIGILMQIAGVCYLIHSFAVLLTPDFGHRIELVTFGALVGEAALTLWLLFGPISPGPVLTAPNALPT